MPSLLSAPHLPAARPRRCNRTSALSSLDILSTPDSIQRAIAAEPWRGGLEPCGDYQLDAVVEQGAIPPALRGTLYRNGPGRVRVGDSKYGHWFDGDGQVTAITLGQGGSVSVASRAMRTQRWQAQAARTHPGFAVRGAWTQATDWWRNLAAPSNPANTSVLRWDGKMLALCEGGPPLEFDPVSLETKGTVRLGARSLLGFGAHCKADGESLFNVGVDLPTMGVRVMKLDAQGREVAGTTISTGGELVFVHDFALSEQHIILFIAPYACSPMDTLSGMLGLSALGHSFRWRDGRGTRCVILRRSDCSVRHDMEVPAFSAYHCGSAWEKDGTLRVHVARLIGSRAALEAQFRDMYSASFAREQYNHLWAYDFDLESGKLLGAQRALADDSGALPFDFPVCDSRGAGCASRVVYTTAYSGRSSFFDAVQRCDLATGRVQTRLCAPGEYPSELTFVPASAEAPETEGFVMYTLYCSQTHSSALVVLDAARFEAEPLCRVALPRHVPHSFHGWWQPAVSPFR